MRHYKLNLNDKEFNVHLVNLDPDEAVLEINGNEYKVSISSVSEVIQETAMPSFATSAAAMPATEAPQPVSTGGNAGSVRAPIPGSIMEVYVKVGDTVKAGQPLFKMEAMKMENEINARIDGTVAAVNISTGDSVNQGDELVVMTPS